MMNGVSWYKKGIMTIEVFFPEGKVMCYNCKLCRKSTKHKSCSQTNQEVTDVYLCGIGSECPLVFEEGEEYEDQDVASR